MKLRINAEDKPAQDFENDRFDLRYGGSG